MDRPGVSHAIVGVFTAIVTFLVRPSSPSCPALTCGNLACGTVSTEPSPTTALLSWLDCLVLSVALLLACAYRGFTLLPRVEAIQDAPAAAQHNGVALEIDPLADRRAARRVRRAILQ